MANCSNMWKLSECIENTHSPRGHWLGHLSDGYINSTSGLAGCLTSIECSIERVG